MYYKLMAILKIFSKDNTLPSFTTWPTLVLNFDFQSSGHPESRLGGHHHAHRHDCG